jgi:hypothetical protein
MSYPCQQKITVRHIAEDDETVSYDMTVSSLTDPQKQPRRYRLHLEKHSSHYDPPGRTSGVASARLRWARDRDDGRWPLVHEFHY